MRKLLLLVALLSAIVVKAEDVSFTVSDGIDNAAVKSKIETAVDCMFKALTLC